MNIASNYQSINPFKKSKIFNPFHGGTALGAVYGLDDINAYETAILIFIGSKHDFRDETQILARVSRKEICRATKLTMPTFCRSIKSLIEKNYIYVSNNYDSNGLQVENTYYISDYLFIKYAELKGVNLREYHTDTPGVSHREIYNTSVAIPSDWIPDEPERSEENINEKNQIDFKIGGSQAEGDGLSLHQVDVQEKELPNSPMANMAHDQEIKDEIDEVFLDEMPVKSVSQQIADKLQKARDDFPEWKMMRVTGWHRKMVMMFKPKKELKSFVRDNDILFLTDQVFEKYGQQSCAIIDKLFTFASENGKCGELAWNVNTVWTLIDAAKKGLDND